MIWGIIYGILGIVMIFSGMKIIVTGSLSAKEEAQTEGFTEKAAKTYKLVSALSYIIVGLMMFGLAVVNVLEEQKIIEDTLPYTIGFAVGAVVLLIIVAVTRVKCKNSSK